MLKKLSTQAVRYSLLSAIFVTLATTGCSSTKDESAGSAGGSETSEAESGGSAKPAQDSGEEDVVRETPMTTGPMVNVMTTLGNESAFDGAVPSAILSESLAAVDEIARKEPDNIGLTTTYLGLLRLYGKSNDTYTTVQRRGGSKGAKNPWFLIEAGYGALKRKDYGLADFLFSKAEKFSNFPNVKSAVAHAQGVRALQMGKTQTGIVLMRKSAEASPAFLPSVMTLGFLGLRYGDSAGAERMFRAASALAPTSINAKVGLTAALRARGKNEEALPIIEPLYKTHNQDRRIVWSYALVLADMPEKNKEAQTVLTAYFQLPNPMPEIDNKANILMTKLQRPIPVAPAAPAAAPANGGAAPAAKPSTSEGEGQ